MQKIKIGHRAKVRDIGNFFLRDFTPYFHFRCVARATFDRNLIHSVDACFLVMVCVGYSRAQLKTLSSLLKIKVVCARISFFNNFNFFESQKTINVHLLDFSEI